MTVSVREATAGDVSAVVEVAEAAWYAAYGGFLEPATIARALERNYDGALLEAALDHEEIAFYVAEIEEDADDAEREIVGFASAEATWADEVELHTLYVHPDRWGEGVGSALLERVLGWARTADVDRVVYAVLADNAVGVDFLEAKGFLPGTEATGEIGGERHPEIEYELPL